MCTWEHQGFGSLGRHLNTRLECYISRCTVSPDARPTPKSFNFFNHHNSINMSAIEPILMALEAANKEKQPNYAKIAKRFSVNRTTLSRRHWGITGS